MDASTYLPSTELMSKFHCFNNFVSLNVRRISERQIAYVWFSICLVLFPLKKNKNEFQVQSEKQGQTRNNWVSFAQNALRVIRRQIYYVMAIVVLTI